MIRPSMNPDFQVRRKSSRRNRPMRGILKIYSQLSQEEADHIQKEFRLRHGFTPIIIDSGADFIPIDK